GAFIAGSTQHAELHTNIFREEELVLISKKPLSSFKDIGDMNLLAFSHGCYYRNLLENWLQEEGISPKRVLEFGTIEAILACVKSGMGVAIMMKSILNGHKHDISFNPLPNSFKKVPTTFITRKDIYHSAALQKFMEMTLNA
ncbi:LysR substrate-binding domain-containing protein, partial [Bacillus thuringiensis]